MPKRSRSAREDANQTAFRVVQESIRDHDEPKKPRAKRKNPAAVALGRKGGLKGGPARAASMTKAARSASAKKAAEARWKDNA